MAWFKDFIRRLNDIRSARPKVSLEILSANNSENPLKNRQHEQIDQYGRTKGVKI